MDQKKRAACTLSDERLRKWGDIDEEEYDLHFEELQSKHWIDVTDEAVRVFGLGFQAEIEDGSPIHAIIGAGCYESARGVFDTVAVVLGVDSRHLRDAVAAWYSEYETTDGVQRTDPIGFDGLKAAIEKEAAAD